MLTSNTALDPTQIFILNSPYRNWSTSNAAQIKGGITPIAAFAFAPLLGYFGDKVVVVIMVFIINGIVAPLPLFHITFSRSSKSLYNLLTLLKNLEHLCLYIELQSQLQILIDAEF